MERANLQIMRMLRERGADILCVTEQDYGDQVVRELEPIGCAWTPVSCLSNLRLPRSPLELWKTLAYWRRTAAAIRRIIADYRPTHIHVTNVMYFLLAWPALRRVKQPVVFRLPNPPDTTLTGIRRLVSNSVWRRVVVPRADRLVANCEFTVAELRKVGVDCRKATVIRNCLPQRAAGPGSSDAPAVRRDRFNVVCTSQVREAKGADFVVDAAARLLREGHPVDVYLAGENDWRNPFADALKQRVIDEGWQDRIHFLGHIEDVFGLLEQCDLHVQPARREVFPNSVLEAKAFGLPSVVSDAGGLPELVEHLVDGYICRDVSAEGLYDGIRYFLDDPGAREAAGRAARRSLERFSEERTSDLWAGLYRDLN
jgi:glycosyltransferase involved in cell wall biosynthesis